MIPSTQTQLADTYPCFKNERAVSFISPYVIFAELTEDDLRGSIENQKPPINFTQKEYEEARARLAEFMLTVAQEDWTLLDYGIMFEQFIYFNQIIASNPEDEAGIRIFLRNNIRQFAEMVLGYIFKTYLADTCIKEELNTEGYAQSVFMTELMVIDSLIRSVAIVLDKDFQSKGFDYFGYAVKVLSALGNLALHRALLFEIMTVRVPRVNREMSDLNNQIASQPTKLYYRVWMSRYEIILGYVRKQMLGETLDPNESKTVPPSQL